MPGKRKNGKHKLNIWLMDEEIRLLDDLAAKSGLNRTEAVRTLILSNAKAGKAIKRKKATTTTTTQPQGKETAQ